MPKKQLLILCRIRKSKIIKYKHQDPSNIFVAIYLCGR